MDGLSQEQDITDTDCGRTILPQRQTTRRITNEGTAMTTMAETDVVVTGGVDTHFDVYVAAALDGIGGQLGVKDFPTTPAGYRPLLEWLASFCTVVQVGVEGTGSYGAGLARYLTAEGIEVVEVDLPCPDDDRVRHQITAPRQGSYSSALRAAQSTLSTSMVMARRGGRETAGSSPG
jgi:transposase